MKKILTIISIAALACACAKSNVQTEETGYGYMNIGVCNDQTMNVSKAEQTVGTEDLANWTAIVKLGETEKYNGTASGLAAQAFAAGDYTVEVYNYADDAAAAAANSNFGAARYTGSANVTVVAGTTQNVDVNCGTAKNARFKVVFTQSFIDICKDNKGEASDNYSLTTKGTRAIAFNKDTAEKCAYYPAKAEVEYTLAYNYNGEQKNFDRSITLGDAATEKTISISANTNGRISINIKYDDSFGDAGTETIVFEAATGNIIEGTE